MLHDAAKIAATVMYRAPEIMSSVKVRTALRETATRSSDCAHFSIQQEWRADASGFEFTAT